MYQVNDDMSVYVTRGDIVNLAVTAEDNGKRYTFHAGDMLRIKVFAKKDCESIVLQKDFPVTSETDTVDIFLDENDTKIGEVISKPKDYWYEIELNPLTNPQTIIGYDEDGTKVFRLFPEGRDLTEDDPVITPEDIPVVDTELSLNSKRPVENQVVTRALYRLEGAIRSNEKKAAKTVDKVFAGVTAEVNALNEALAIERARITNIATLEEGSTTGDAEMIDARIGVDGFIGSNLGESIRGQFNMLAKAVGVDINISSVKYVSPNGSGDIVAQYSGYIKTNGEREDTNTYNCSDLLPINERTVIEIKLIGYTHMCSVAFYDENKAFISGLIGSHTFDTSHTGFVNIPSGASYVRFSFLAQETDLYAIITKANIASAIDSLYSDSAYYDYEAIESNAKKQALLDINGNDLGSNSWCVSHYMPINKNCTISYNLKGYTTVSSVAFYDNEYKFISGIVASTDGMISDTGIAPPDNACYLRYCAVVGYTEQYFEITKKRIDSLEVEVERMATNNPLYRKIMTATGDSITATTSNRPYASYAKMIAQKNEMTYETKAIWGATIATNIRYASGCILDTLSQMRDDADYIILSGGANDFYYLNSGKEQLGEITDGYTDTFDTDTFCGALETMCKTAIEKWVGKKIVFVITHRMLDISDQTRLQHYIETLIKVLEKWGVPYVDLWRNVPSLMLPSLKDSYTTMGNTEYNGTGDGLHPNEEGYRKFYVPKVEAILKTL